MTTLGFILAESTVRFISKSELAVMETDVLGCTTNQHLARFVFLLLLICLF